MLACYCMLSIGVAAYIGWASVALGVRKPPLVDPETPYTVRYLTFNNLGNGNGVIKIIVNLK